ncbi:ATP-binding protein [Oscillospiraceae bacterium MB08-C2-2]|nr:ATP-binding protein [Oscillospiraceae bacterium MB08-C2-2]
MAALSLIVVSYSVFYAHGLLVLNMPVIIVIMIIGLRFSTSMDWLQAVYGGATSILSAYCFRGIFTAIGALIFRGRDLLSDADAYYAITLAALPAALLSFSVLRRTIFPDHKMKRFLKNRGQLKTIVAYEMVATINLVAINSGRQSSPNNLWYVQVALGACVLALGMLVFAIYQSIYSAELLEYRLQSEMLEQQYNRQLAHYKSYQKYTESFRAFRHDYKAMMASVKSLIRAGEAEKAIALVDDVYDDMQKKVHLHKKYSDNVVLDAMLQDLANQCAEKEIEFSFQVFAPRNTDLSRLNAIRLFSNLTTNAVEACDKLPVSERFMHIVSTAEPSWVVLKVENSYNGETVENAGKLITTKEEKDMHGLGLGIVNEIAENLGGFVLYDIAPENKLFTVRVFIPQTKADDHPDV